MISKVKKLTVKYNGETVGYLADLDDGIAFQYDEKWVKNGFSISPFSLPLSNKIYRSSKATFGGLYGVFHDSLPDGWGELLVRRMLAKQGINADRLSPLTKLTLISGSGLGALTYEPTQIADDETDNFDLDFIASEAEKILDDETDNVNLDEIYRLGGSSGGARPKAHVKIDGESWIIKFPCNYDPKNIGERELQANKLARACGINVSEFKLYPSKLCSGYFGTKRFDRQGEKRVHMISLASLLETTHKVPNLDYMHFFQVVKEICIDKDDLYEAYRRMCFNVLYGNRDDHGKNFAFLYNEQKGGYELSPAYDITPTLNKPEHEMTVLGNGQPTEEDLLKIAKEIKLSLKDCKEIIQIIKYVLSK